MAQPPVTLFPGAGASLGANGDANDPAVQLLNPQQTVTVRGQPVQLKTNTSYERSGNRVQTRLIT